jgi:hypothetical protein
MNEKGYTRRRFLVLVSTVAAGAACAGCVGAAATSGSSQVRCPKGMVNDPYPGRCHAYRDTNGNGYCDLSETET